MRPLPRDNRRPALLLATLGALAAAVIALSAAVWVQHQSEDRGYATQLRRALRKYGAPEAVPQASAVWLARKHGRAIAEVRQDLATKAQDPSALDPDEPLHEEPTFLVQLYLDLGLLGLWLVLFAASVVVLAPVVGVVHRLAQPPPRRRPAPGAGWS